MSLISHKGKFIFIHIPKTGGASIKSSILNYDRDATPIGYHDGMTIDIKKKYIGYYSFAIIRNSYEILASRYRFGHIRYNIKENYPEFKQWLLNSDNEQYAAINTRVIDQLGMISDSAGNLLVDEFINHRELETGIKRLNAKLKTNIILPTSKGHYYGEYNWRDYYKDEETIEIATSLCQRDINYFGFKF
jgi:hypothetical protein